MGVGKGISLAPASLGVQRRECRVWDNGVEGHQRAHPAPLRDSKGRTEVWPPLPPGSYLETERKTCEGPVTPPCPPTPGYCHTHWEPDEVGPPGVDPLGISRAWALLGEKGNLEVTSCPTSLAPSTQYRLERLTHLWLWGSPKCSGLFFPSMV